MTVKLSLRSEDVTLYLTQYYSSRSYELTNYPIESIPELLVQVNGKMVRTSYVDFLGDDSTLAVYVPIDDRSHRYVGAIFQKRSDRWQLITLPVEVREEHIGSLDMKVRISLWGYLAGIK